MKEGQFSETAIGVASLRAQHYENDKPLIYADAYAGLLLGKSEREWARQLELMLVSEADRERIEFVPDPAERERAMCRAIRFSGTVLVTYRCAQEWTQEALADGASQLVVLGAGLDSMCLQFSEHSGDLQIFEVDHPATQRHKRQRMAECGLVPRHSTEFLPVDFEIFDLSAALDASSFCQDRQTIVTWLNCTYFLTGRAIVDTFETLSRKISTGSIVIFDLYDQEIERSPHETEADRRMASVTTSLGEPPAVSLRPSEVTTTLGAMGYQNIEMIRPETVKPWHEMARGLGYDFMSGSYVVRATR